MIHANKPFFSVQFHPEARAGPTDTVFLFNVFIERYKLFVINKNTFETEYNIEQYGINLVREKDKIVVDTLKWNGEAKKSGFEMGLKIFQKLMKF